MISHSSEFTSALCPEKWTVADGKLAIEGQTDAQKEQAKLEWKRQEEMTDAFGNTIKVKAPKKVCFCPPFPMPTCLSRTHGSCMTCTSVPRDEHMCSMHGTCCIFGVSDMELRVWLLSSMGVAVELMGRGVCAAEAEQQGEEAAGEGAGSAAGPWGGGLRHG